MSEIVKDLVKVELLSEVLEESVCRLERVRGVILMTHLLVLGIVKAVDPPGPAGAVFLVMVGTAAVAKLVESGLISPFLVYFCCFENVRPSLSLHVYMTRLRFQTLHAS